MKRVQLSLLSKKDKLYELRLYGVFGVDITLQDIISEMKNATGATRVLLRIHSPGGDPLEGMAILQHFQALCIPVDTQNDGIAASMAGVLYAIGEKRYSGKYSKFMTHEASGSLKGNSAMMTSTSKLLDEINIEQRDIFAKATGKEPDYITANWIKAGADKWFTAQEALEAGLVNQPLLNTTATEFAGTSLSLMVEHFDKHLFNNHTKTKMELELLTFELNKADGVKLDAQASLAQVATSVAKVVSANLKLRAEADAATAKVAELEAAQVTLQAKALTDKATALVDAAEAAAKITAAQKAHYLSLASKDDSTFDTVKGILDNMTGYVSVSTQLAAKQSAATPADNALLALSWDEAMKSKKLEVIKAKFPEHYETLFESKYNRKPSKD